MMYQGPRKLMKVESGDNGCFFATDKGGRINEFVYNCLKEELGKPGERCKKGAQCARLVLDEKTEWTITLGEDVSGVLKLSCLPRSTLRTITCGGQQ